MKRLVLFLLIFKVSNLAYSSELGEQFCAHKANSEQAQQDVKKPGMIKMLFNTLITPRSFIEFQSLKIDEELKSSKESKNKLIFSTLPRVSFLKEEKEEFKKVEKSVKRIRKKLKEINFLDQLKRTQDHESCLNEYNKFETGYPELFQKLKEIGPRYDLLAKKKTDASAYDLVAKKLSFTKRKSIYFKKEARFINTFRKIKSSAERPTEVMIVAHSNEKGHLYDVDMNIIPKGFFKSLPQKVKRLIIYSCNMDQVVKYYGLNELTSRMEVVHPVVKSKFEGLYQDSVPFISIKRVKKVLKSPLREFENGDQKLCSIKVEFSTKHEGLGLYVNKKFVSTIEVDKENQKVALFCDEIKEDVLIEIYSLDKEKVDPTFIPKAANVELESEEGLFERLTLKDFFSRREGHHIVSKTKLTKLEE